MRIALKFSFCAPKPQRIWSLLCSWLVNSTTGLPGKTLKNNNLAIYAVLSIFLVFCTSLDNQATSGGLYDMSRLINEPHPFENINYESSLRLEKDIAQPIAPKMIVNSPKRLSKNVSPTPISKPTKIIGSIKNAKTKASPTPILKPKFLTVLPELLITATMAPTSPKKIGSAVTVINEEEIRQRNTSSIPELLRDVPGLAVNRSGPVGGFTQIRMRGSEADQLIFLVDGVEANDPNTSEPLWDDIFPGDIERIEVLRGSQSSIHGSDAIGGVIHIITKRGRGKPKVSASVEAGSFETVRGGSSISGGSEKYHYALNVIGYSTRGISESKTSNVNPEPNDKDGYRNFTASTKLGLTPQKNLDFQFTGRYIQTTNQIDNFSATDGGPDQIDTNREIRRTQFIGGTTGIHKSFDGAWENGLKAQWTEQHAKTFQDGEFAAFGKSVGRKIKLGYHNTIKFNTKDFANSRHTITTGLETENEKAVTDSFKKSRDQDGFFGEYQLDVFDKITLTGSGRYDTNDLFENAKTWRSTAAYRIDGLGTKFRTSYATGIKNPTFFDLFGGNDDFVPNSNLKPESNKSYDFGVDQSLFNGRVFLANTLFFNRIKDRISGSGNSVINQGGTTKIWGNEITIDGNLTNNLSLNASYTYTNHKDTNGQELTRRAQHIASTNIQHSLLDERARLFLNIDFNGSQADDDFDAAFNRSRVKLDAFTNITLGGAYKIYDGMIVKARIENLLDDQYEEVFGFQSQGLGIYLGIGSEF